jgi:hypothetical protein
MRRTQRLAAVLAHTWRHQKCALHCVGSDVPSALISANRTTDEALQNESRTPRHPARFPPYGGTPNSATLRSIARGSFARAAAVILQGPTAAGQNSEIRPHSSWASDRGSLCRSLNLPLRLSDAKRGVIRQLCLRAHQSLGGTLAHYAMRYKLSDGELPSRVRGFVAAG